MRRALDHIEIPNEHEARERSWRVVATAFVEREPTPSRRAPRRLVAVVAIVVLAAVVAAAFSPPGRALLRSLGETVGVRSSAPALFSLPTAGQLLVTSDAGVWVVQADGSKRLLGRYSEASWSPHGRFVVATRPNELAALEPDGHVRWTLSRPGVHSARWAGTKTDTRIAYFDKTGLRVVAGDGRGDRLIAPREDSLLAWRPHTAGFVLDYFAGTQLRIKNVETQRVFVRNNLGSFDEDRALAWSPDGRRALVVNPFKLTLVDVESDTRRTIPAHRLEGIIDSAAFAPDGSRLAVLETNQLLIYDVHRPRRAPWRILAGPDFQGFAWSPDGRWLLVGSPTADQWLFVSTADGRIRAVSNISAQFRSQEFPRVEGWCCAG